MQTGWFAVLGLCAFALAGCGSSAQNAAPIPSATRDANFVPSPDSSAPTLTEFFRPTLPPEWTPLPGETFVPTETPLPVPTGDATGTWLFRQPTATVCSNFRADVSQNLATFLPGLDLPITWQPVEGATGYKVTVQDQNMNTVFEDLTSAATMYVIPGSVLEVQPFYVWSVRPYEGAGRQLCNAVGLLVNLSI
jgi:hypothetical protein